MELRFGPKGLRFPLSTRTDYLRTHMARQLSVCYLGLTDKRDIGPFIFNFYTPQFIYKNKNKERQFDEKKSQNDGRLYVFRAIRGKLWFFISQVRRRPILSCWICVRLIETTIFRRWNKTVQPAGTLLG